MVLTYRSLSLYQFFSDAYQERLRVMALRSLDNLSRRTDFRYIGPDSIGIRYTTRKGANSIPSITGQISQIQSSQLLSKYCKLI